MERSSRIFYGLLALGAFGILGWGLAEGGAEGLAFGLFAALTLGGGLVCVFERSVVRSAFALMATFGGVAGLFVLLESDFLAMAQILIYVGGILALLLFGVMLTPPDMKERSLARVVAGLVIVGGAVTWVATRFAPDVLWAGARARATPLPDVAAGAASEAELLGIGFVAPRQYLIAFELAGVVLTVALVAAVYIARRRRVDYARSEGAA
jgi:NADH-quinone oxidoreductase subunit J